MTYQLNTSIHNTQWVTGHFHLIFGGAIVIMYFAIAYDLWPHLTGRSSTASPHAGAAVALVHRHDGDVLPMALGRHPRHAPAHGIFRLFQSRAAAGGVWVIVSAIGGLILVASGIVFFAVLVRGSLAPRAEIEPYRFAEAVHPPVRVPAAFNGYTVWVTLMILLTVTNYGFPVLQSRGAVTERRCLPSMWE